MTYSWFIDSCDPALQESLDIAIQYLELTGQAFPYSETERRCAEIIVEEWRVGRRHRIWLANKAIVSVEQRQRPTQAAGVTVLSSARRQ
jgi:hypothetical protein